jgi:hypothetical protein
MISMPQLQQTAQANLPVLPNNGNPAGANNMPANTLQPQPPAQQQASATPIQAGAVQPTPQQPSWMNPSSSMDMINQLLAGQDAFNNQVNPVAPQTGLPAIGAPIGTANPIQPTGATLPIQQAPPPSGPVLPQQGSSQISPIRGGMGNPVNMPVLPLGNNYGPRYLQ